MPEASFSRVRTWRRCHKRYDYKYNQRLARKKPKVALFKGNIIHDMLDAKANKQPPIKILNDYAKEYRNMLLEEREMYGDIIGDIQRIFAGYERHYIADKLKVIRSEEFVATDLTSKLRFIGYIDKRVTDQDGRMWIVDHKTSRSIPGPDARYSDLQLVFYTWAYNQEHPNEKISGVIWDYIRTKPPTIPEILKSGALSVAKNITTDYYTYRKAIDDNGLNPDDYTEVLARLESQESPFFLRVKLPNPPKSMVEQVVADFKNTAIEMTNLSGVSMARNLGRDCSTCEYFSLCHAELRGQDSNFIRKNEYIEKESRENGEEESETDGEG